jgi:hypothetical protein
MTTRSGAALAQATSLLAGQTPATAHTGLTGVTVSWPASAFASGAAAPAYVVTRYNTLTGSPSAATGTCAGSVAATSCTEPSVPIGVWRYTVTPVDGAWLGAESPQSASITVV